MNRLATVATCDRPRRWRGTGIAACGGGDGTTVTRPGAVGLAGHVDHRQAPRPPRPRPRRRRHRRRRPATTTVGARSPATITAASGAADARPGLRVQLRGVNRDGEYTRRCPCPPAAVERGRDQARLPDRRHRRGQDRCCADAAARPGRAGGWSRRARELRVVAEAPPDAEALIAAIPSMSLMADASLPAGGRRRALDGEAGGGQ